MARTNIKDIDFYEGHYWAFDVKVTPRIVREIYRLMVTPNNLRPVLRQVSQVVRATDIWKESANKTELTELLEDAKRVIYCLSSRKPEVDQMVQSLYVLALKYKKLNLLDSIGDVEWKVIDKVFASSALWIDQERLLKFYKRYACKKRQFNAIKIPEGFPPCETK